MILRKSTLLTIITIGLFILLNTQSYTQGGLLTLNFSSAMGETGTRVCVNVTAGNFTNIESIQFNLSYNANLVVPECPATYVHPDLLNNIFGDVFNCNTKNNGYVNFVWAGNNPTTIPDGEIVFTLCFNIIGPPGNKSPVYFNGLILDLEICKQLPNGQTSCTDQLNSNVGTIMIISNTLNIVYNKCDADANNIAAGGNLTFYATAGTPPYNYTINPVGYTGTINIDGQRTTINNIPEGNYTISVTDANGLNAVSTPINISNNLPLKVDSFLIINPTCFDKKNGMINLKGVSGGITPYNYEWSNFLSGGDSFRKISGLKIDTYTVTITDFSGCQKKEEFTLNVDTLKYNIAVKDTASCVGARNGSFIINASGGSPYKNFNYQYRVNGTIWRNFNSPADIPLIGSGNYNVEVKDSLGCSVTRAITMPFLKTVSIDLIEKKDISCFGKTDGSVMLLAQPGTGYAYIPNPNIPSGTLGGVFIADNLPKGSYSVTVRDGAGCTANITYTISEPEVITIIPTVVQPECITSGSITLNPTGGTGAYTYNWLPDSGDVNSLTNLTGGNYSVTVSDINKCTATFAVLLNQQGSLNITPKIQKNITCNGTKDGILFIDVLAPIANGPFTFSWRNESGTEISISQTANFLGPGTYSVQVTDKNGCSNTASNIILTEPAPIVTTTTINPAPCFNTNGNATIDITGGTTGFTYEWREKGKTPIIGNTKTLSAKAGIYTVKVINASGCEKEVEITISEPEAITFPVPETRNATCFGLSNGSAIIPNSPSGINFIWSSGSTGTSVLNLSVGPNWVIASKGTCKSDTVKFEIFSYPKLTIDKTKTVVTNPVCFGSSDGSVTIEAKGGTAIGYTYSWGNGKPGPTLSNIKAGAYIVTIMDSNNCTQSDTFFLTQPDKLVAFLDRSKTVELDCNNQNSGKIALLTTGGNAGKKTITWQSGIIVQNEVATGLSSGRYCATISDNFGCKDTFCYSMIAPSPLKGKLKTAPEPLCNGGTTCLSVDYLRGGTGNKYTFQINNGKRYPIDSCVTVFAGRYFINLIDSAGCSIDTVITILQPDPVAVDAGPDVEIQLGLPSPVIRAVINSTVGLDNIIWSPVEGLSCVSSDCTTVELNPTTSTTYTLLVTDKNGCTGSDKVTVTVKNVRNVYFANIFTPNRDGENDFFQAVTGPGVEKIIAFAIYDRWGNKVFEKSNYVPDPTGNDGWDGTFSGQRLDPGVFVYFAKALFIDGKEIDYSGSVTLADKVRN